MRQYFLFRNSLKSRISGVDLYILAYFQYNFKNKYYKILSYICAFFILCIKIGGLYLL